MFLRNTGKLCFATLADQFTPDADGDRLQVMLSLAEVGQESLDRWKADVDLGDFVSVTGRVIASKRGELSIMATELGAGVEGAAPAADAAQGPVGGGPRPPALRRPGRARRGPRDGAHARRDHPASARRCTGWATSRSRRRRCS
jgi:hypothetical protein